MHQPMITETSLTALIQEKLAGLCRQPTYNWPDDLLPFQADAAGLPLLRVALGTCPSSFDIWHDIRGPASTGLYPATLEDLWSFYETQVQTQVQWAGDTSYHFPVPAFPDFPYAGVVSVMAVASPAHLEAQAELLDQGQLGSADYYTAAWGCLNHLLETALTRAAMQLYSQELVAVPLTHVTLDTLRAEVIPAFHQANRHGPDKGGNWPHKSAAFMTGLGQFGASHLIFRDEVVKGQVQRFYGQIRSLVLFSREDQLQGGVRLDDPAYRQLLHRLARFDERGEGPTDLRFCRFGHGCAACITACPSGALSLSLPRQGARRDAGGWQPFAARPCRDFARHDRVFPGWVCARCAAACARRGKSDAQAVSRYWEERERLFPRT